jgi:hypothetical protein
MQEVSHVATEQTILKSQTTIAFKRTHKCKENRADTLLAIDYNENIAYFGHDLNVNNK